MLNLQRELLGWAATQPALTGALVLMAGVVYAFYGFKLFPVLLALAGGGLGYLGAAIAADLLNWPAGWLATGTAIAAAAAAGRWRRVAICVVAAAIWGMLGYYIAAQASLPRQVPWFAAAGGAFLGALFAWLCYRTMMVILTTLLGSILMIVGFVAVSTRVLPAVGETFRHWANSQALLVPIFMAMLCATAYSYQAMRQQGDIRTGG